MDEQTAGTERRSGWIATGTSVMAATAFPAATDAALEMLRQGGNAVDAAVAAAWALTVCEPSGSGLGGQTTMLIHHPSGQTVVLDGHSQAPAAVSRKTVSPAQQRLGYRACTIPSTPATLAAAQRRFGRLTHAATLGPAVRLAEEGFPVTRLLRRQVRWCRDALQHDRLAQRVLLRKGRLPRRGRLLRQKRLARTLRRLAEFGADDFYRGELARKIVVDMERRGGLMTAADLAAQRQPVERATLSISYGGYRVMSAPPPGGGVQLLLALRVTEALLSEAKEADLPDWYEAIALAIEAVFRERDRWPVHPDALTPSLRRWLLSRERSAEIAVAAREGRPAAEVGGQEPGETTHLCTGDADGMIVSLTQSIQSLFGAKVGNRRLGFFYNNYLRTCPRGHHPYRLRSGALPQSNAAPTLVLDGTGRAPRPVLALGAAGSRRITSALLQVLTHTLARGLPLEQAIDAPRIHARLSGDLMLEERIAGEEIRGHLARRFPRQIVKAARSYAMGAVQAIGRTAEGGWIGVADPRREGTADGF